MIYWPSFLGSTDGNLLPYVSASTLDVFEKVKRKTMASFVGGLLSARDILGEKKS